MIDTIVMDLLEAVPEFAGRFLELVEAGDDDPGAAVVLPELAEWLAELLDSAPTPPTACIARCMAAVEALAGGPDAEELVGWSFLDLFGPEDLARLDPWFGPSSRKVLRTLGAW